MDKPVAAIERMRKNWQVNAEDLNALLDYLDSIPDGAVAVVWPADLTRERLEWLARYAPAANGVASALYELAAIAPERKKRMVNLWDMFDGGDPVAKPVDWLPSHSGWKIVARNVELED